MTFSEALEALKEGKKVRRKGWQREPVFLFLELEGKGETRGFWVRAAVRSNIEGGGERAFELAQKALESVHCSPFNNKWNPTSEDLLAEDWIILE